LSSNAALVGSPPRQFITALVNGGTSLDESFLQLACAWSRPDMSRAMLDALASVPTVREREQAAWLLKRVLAVEHSAEAIDRVLDTEEDAQVRRWLVEALERLALGADFGWDQLGPVVTLLAGERQPVLRSGLALLLSTLPWRPGNTPLLEELLLHDDHEVVSAGAYTLARHPDAVLTLQPTTLDHLRAHPNPMMRHCATLLEASIRRIRP
jgi:hypothetical protein